MEFRKIQLRQTNHNKEALKNMTVLEDLYNVTLPGLDTIDDHENPLVQAHFTDSINRYHWYVVAGDELPNGDMQLFCLVKLLTVEFGLCNLSQLTEIGVQFDKDWEPIGMYDVKKQLTTMED